MDPHLHILAFPRVPAGNPCLPVPGIEVVNMASHVRLKVPGDGMLKTAAKLEVRLRVGSLEVLDAQSQPHPMGFQLGNIEQVAIRI